MRLRKQLNSAWPEGGQVEDIIRFIFKTYSVKLNNENVDESSETIQNELLKVIDFLIERVFNCAHDFD